MKRVCIVRHKGYPRGVPTRRNAETLALHGYEVDVICLREPGQVKYEEIHGVNVYRVPVRHQRNGVLRYVFEYLAFSFLAFLKLSWLSVKKRYHVVEVENMPDFLVFTTLIPKLMGTKVVLHILDNMPEIFVDSFRVDPDHILVRMLRVVERMSTAWADHVVATQVICKRLLESRGVRSSKISVVLNVPDDDNFHQVPTPNHDGRFRLITHGSIVERYNVQTLIKAVPLLTQEIPELEVKIVGEGEYRPRLEEMAQSLGVSEYIDFTGWVPFEQVPAYISQADIGVVVIPAGANPAMPNKLFEYLAMGKPSIATSIPTITAYFDNDSVIFYEPDNEHDLARCILELYRDPAKRKALSTAALAAYQRYRWAAHKREYLNVFERLVNNQLRSPKEGAGDA